MSMGPGPIRLINQYVRQSIRNLRKQGIVMLPLLLPLSVIAGKYEKKEQKLSGLDCRVRKTPSHGLP